MELIDMKLEKDNNVQIVVRHDRKVIWVNVNEVCVLRICRIDNLVVVENSRGGIATLQQKG